MNTHISPAVKLRHWLDPTLHNAMEDLPSALDVCSVSSRQPAVVGYASTNRHRKL